MNTPTIRRLTPSCRHQLSALAPHKVQENDNNAIDTVAKTWSGMARMCDCAVELAHHIRKEEAENVGIKPDQRRRYFRVEAGKTNMKPPAENIEWRKLVAVPLDNATPEDEGDWVGVVTKWKMPGALEGVTASDLLRVQKRVSEDKWREDSRAMAWVGKAVAETLNLNVREPAVKKRIIGMIKIWIDSGALRIVEADDDRRHKKEFVEVGEWAT